jgi:predicted dehydrogenase
MPEVQLVAICDKDPAQAAPLAAEHGRDAQPLPVYSKVDDMLAEIAPDLVDVTAPPVAHLPLLEAIVPKVPRVICQKPFCGGSVGARAALALAEAYGTRIAVHENVRFQPWYREVRRLLEAGAIGTAYQVSFRLRPGDGQGESAYLDRQPYFQEMTKFLVHETAIHWIDTFRYLFGEITGVFARLARLNPAIAGEDAGLILFDFANGARGLFDGNRLSDHAARDRRRTMGELWVEGDEGTLRLDGDGRLWLRVFGSNEEREQTFSWRDHLFGGDCVYHCNRAIFEAWQAGRAAPTEAQAYLRNQEIEDAIYRSAEQGAYLAV